MVRSRKEGRAVGDEGVILVVYEGGGGGGVLVLGLLLVSVEDAQRRWRKRLGILVISMMMRKMR